MFDSRSPLKILPGDLEVVNPSGNNIRTNLLPEGA